MVNLIINNPNLMTCPDYTTPDYQAMRAIFITNQTNEAQAMQILWDAWTAGNDAEKVIWQHEEAQKAADSIDTKRILHEAQEAAIEAKRQAQDIVHVEEVKKNKGKYTPILNWPPPSKLPKLVLEYA